MEGNKKLNILVANSSLDAIGGTETFSYTLIEELVKRGHNVSYFTFYKGFVSNKIEKDLNVFYMKHKKYDLILANHNTCVQKLAHRGFIVQTCHGVFPPLEQPSKYADAHVAISKEVQEHLSDLGFDSRLILNGINCNRFQPLKPLNKELKAVLSLCHSDRANDKLKTICDDLKIELQIAYKYKDPIWDVEQEINKVDMIVGVGRSVYEAMACGRPVVVWDDRGYYNSVGDGYAKDVLKNSILNNCSGRYSGKSYTISELKQEIVKYDYQDQSFFRNFALTNLNISTNIIDYLDLGTNTKNSKAPSFFHNSAKYFQYLKVSIRFFRKKTLAEFKKFFKKNNS